MDIQKIKEIILKNRLQDYSKEQYQRHLDAKYDFISSPFLLQGMDVATQIFLEAIDKGKKFAIYADYDADGILGAVIMADFFRMIDYKNYVVYLPHRHKEGYGVHKEAIDFLKNEGVDFLITIDVGITEIDSIKHAKELGMTVLVTDHHEPPKELPNADVLINPKLGNYPDRMLCGAATIFQFVRAVLSKKSFGLPEGIEKWFLDLVGIATLSDMVPLINENRILAKWGLVVLAKSRRPAIKNILKGQKDNVILEDDVVFNLTPKINAASRMGNPNQAFDWLFSANSFLAEKCFLDLINLDKKRKTETVIHMKQANLLVKQKGSIPIVLVGRIDWNPGILSLIAGKLADKENKPVFVWTETSKGMIKGSCRAVLDFDVYQMLSDLPKGFLDHFGGHQKAAGFSLKKEKIHFLEEELLKVFKPEPIDEQKDRGVFFDSDVGLDFVGNDFYEELRSLGPFGEGYPKPIFRFKNVLVSELKRFGKNKEHRRITLTDEKGNKRQLVKFFSEEKDPLIGEKIEVLASIEKDKMGYGDTYFLMEVNLAKTKD